MISFAQGKLTRIESITRIRKDYYAVCSFEDGNGDEFKRSVNHKHWPLQHLYKFKGVIFIFTISSEDEFDLLPLEFQPEFIKLQLFNDYYRVLIKQVGIGLGLDLHSLG